MISGLRISPLKVRYIPAQIYNTSISSMICELEEEETENKTDQSQIHRGYGESFFSNKAKLKSFNEAFERLILFKFKNLDRNIKNSNGIAAHQELERAKYSSKIELLERYAVLEAWKAKKGWTSCEMPWWSAPLLSKLDKQGWDIFIYQVSINKNYSVYVLLAKHKDFGAVLDAQAVATDQATLTTYLKLIQSAYRMVALNRAIHESGQHKNFRLNSVATPHDHGVFL